MSRAEKGKYKAPLEESASERGHFGSFDPEPHSRCEQSVCGISKKLWGGAGKVWDETLSSAARVNSVELEEDSRPHLYGPTEPVLIDALEAEVEGVAQVCGREEEAVAVEDVEGLCADFERDGLRQPRLLQQADVLVVERVGPQA